MIIVLGGKGFIGKALCKELKKAGKEYLIADLPEYNITKQDHINYLLDNYKVSKIVYLSAISHIPQANKQPSKTVEINALGVMKLLETIRIRKQQGMLKQFIYMSSASVQNTLDAYGTSKLIGELLTTMFRAYGFNTTVVRTSSVYGPGDPFKRVVHKFVENAILGIPITIEGGEQKRVFTYLDDVVRGLMLTIDNPKAENKIINITGKEEVSIKQLALKIKKLVPNAEVTINPGRKLDKSKIKMENTGKLVGYEAEWTLDRGLEEVKEWIQQKRT